jgi:beta-barrel assembly-enhancing protease
MSSQLIRKFTTPALVLSLLGGTFAAAAPRQDQTQTPAPQTTTAKQDDKDKTAQPAEQTADNTKPTTTASTAPKKPLAVNEDPAMIGKRNLNKGLIAKMSMSVDKEVAMGRQLSAEVDREAKFIDDPVVTEYVNRVAQNIVLHSDAKIPFTVKVIDSDEVNAFALPGGFFYVNKGLILAADNEAELAGVIGHEISHVIARHAVENQTKGTMAEIGLIASSIFLGGLPGMAIYNAEQFGALAMFMKFSRANEAEADRLGVQYMYAAGYDPNAMSTMFEKLAAQNKKKPGFLSKAFASHPQSVERMEAARALVARFPEREEYVLNTSEFQRVKARLLRLSNSKATTAGSLTDDNGQPKRPTLKRRQPTPDDSTNTNTNSSDSDKPTTDQQQGPPKLKRRDQTPPPPSNDNQP